MSDHISKQQLDNYYREAGRLFNEWFNHLLCPNCQEKSALDWVLEEHCNGIPKLVCRRCGKIYPINGLQFKQNKLTYRAQPLERKFFSLPEKVEKHP